VNPLLSKTKLLQITMWLIQTIKQGKISLQTNGIENVELGIENKKLDLNFLQKEQLKTLLELKAELEEESILKRLTTLKNLAENLKQNGLTITISHKGQMILTLGSEAHSTISQMVTGTDAIEVNNLIELVKLAG